MAPRRPLQSKNQPKVTLTILGCGTSTGVPLIGCECKVCRSKNPRNKRLRASAWIQTRDRSFLIDTSTDLRQQALREKIRRVDAVLFTHPHADHIHGIDELRSYNFLQQSTLPIYAHPWTFEELTERFPYIFKPKPIEGGGIPLLQLNRFEPPAAGLEIAGVPVVPVFLKHGSRESVGYRFGPVAYITDCNEIPEASLERLQGLSVLVLDCLRLAPHGTHFNLDQALKAVSKIRPKQTYLTHLSHDFDYSQWAKKLPKGVSLAYDGLRITV